MTEPKFVAACACGQVRWAARAAPILAAVCYCDDCQAGARQIEALGGPRLASDDGGTSYVLFRRDRFDCVSGEEALTDLRLKPDSPTRRVVARCCNTGLFADFQRGHWLSVYRDRIAPAPPRPTMAVMTRFRPAGPPLELPAHKAYAPGFMWKLLTSRLAMAVGR